MYSFCTSKKCACMSVLHAIAGVALGSAAILALKCICKDAKKCKDSLCKDFSCLDNCDSEN